MLEMSVTDPASPASYTTSFALGVLLHIAFFRTGEWDLYTPHLLAGSAVLQVLATYSLVHFGSESTISIFEASRIVLCYISACVGGIYSSILVYRAAFHRLNRFPGPFLARLSNAYVTSLSVKNFHLFEEIRDLHAKYGDIVRVGKLITLLFVICLDADDVTTGPSELSIADPSVYGLIHSNQSPCEKGPWYNVMHPVKSLHMIRDRKEHSQRRKTWDKGLGSKGMYRTILIYLLVDVDGIQSPERLRASS